MTAAGTVTPAQVVVLGAGVAGLQAIATAKRLGGVVSAYDVRASSADEVKSMGAKVITLELEALEGAGGYAREMTEERAAKQRELLTPYLAAADVVITTAAVPGRAAAAPWARLLKPPATGCAQKTFHSYRPAMTCRSGSRWQPGCTVTTASHGRRCSAARRPWMTGSASNGRGSSFTRRR